MDSNKFIAYLDVITLVNSKLWMAHDDITLILVEIYWIVPHWLWKGKGANIEVGEPLTSLASLWSGKCPLQSYRTNIGGGSTPLSPPPPARQRYPVLLCSRSPCFDRGQRSHDEEHMVSFHVHGGLIGPTIFMAVKTIDQKSYSLLCIE